MSDQNQNERKNESNGESKNNTRSSAQESNLSVVEDDQSFHTAPEYLTSDEENKKEPSSSFALTASSHISDVSSSVNQDEIDETKRQSFRASLSLHHLKTIKSSTHQIPPPTNSAITMQASQSTVMPSPEQSHLPTTAEVLAPAPIDKQLSNISGKSRSSLSVQRVPHVPKRMSVRARSSSDASRRQSRRSLKNDESFRTNLNPGDAFVYMVLPPDGGYGWVIVFISFLVQIITDGIVFSIGIVLPAMAEDLGVDMTQAILISALQICFYYLSGPITSAVINKYGFRFVAMLGASIGCVSLLIASFSPNLEMLLIFYSVLGGPSLAMTWVASQLIIGYYFEKYRSIANGLSCSGSGAGLIIFVQLNTYLVPELGWRNNTRIQAGLLILALLLSIAYAEVPPSKIGIIREQDPEIEISEEDFLDEREVVVGTFNYADPITVDPEDRGVEYLKLEKVPTKDLIALKKRESSRFRKWTNKFCWCKRKRKSYELEDESGQPLTKRYVIKKDLLDRQDLYYTGPAEYTDHDHVAKREIIDGKDVELIEIDRPVHSINYSMSKFSTPKSEDSKEENQTKSKCCYYLNPSNWVSKPIKKIFHILFNFSLFYIMEFRVLFTSAALFGLAFNIPFLFSKSRLDLPTELMSYIPIFIGITNFSFRIICGFIAFKFKKHVIYLSGGTVALGGLACVVSAFYGNDNFWFQIAYASVFGVAPAFFSTLRAIIYVQYLGLENLTNAFGLVSMGMGFAILVGTMIGGLLNKVTGNYTAAFAFAGFCIIASGSLNLILPYLSQRRQASRKVKFQV